MPTTLLYSQSCIHHDCNQYKFHYHFYAVIERLRGKCWKICGPLHDARTKRSDVRTRSLVSNIFLQWSSKCSMKALHNAEYFKTLIENSELKKNHFSVFHFPISFTLSIRNKFQNKSRGYITWLYQRRSIRLLQTDEKLIRLRHCRSEQPYLRTPYNNTVLLLYSFYTFYIIYLITPHLSNFSLFLPCTYLSPHDNITPHLYQVSLLTPCPHLASILLNKILFISHTLYPILTFPSYDYIKTHLSNSQLLHPVVIFAPINHTTSFSINFLHKDLV